MYDSPLLNGIGYPVSGLIFFLLIWIASYNKAFDKKDSIIYKFLLYLGDRSYTIYIFHFTIFVITWIIIARSIPWVFYKSGYYYGVAQLVITAALMVPIIEVLFRYVELPFIEIGKNVTKLVSRTKTNDQMKAEDPLPESIGK